jgi:sugar/nucleoside kinase (ribokinase family)
MKPELITIGSCTLDCMIEIDDILRFELLDKDVVKKYTAIEYSRKLNIQNVKFVPGGSAANIASNCAMLGLRSSYLGILGKDFSAQICLEDMKSRGVDLSNIKQTEEDNTAFSVILKTEWGKDRSILAYKGANDLLTPDDVPEEIFEEIKAFAWTSLTKEGAVKAIDRAIEITKKKGGKIYAAPSMSIIKNNPKWAKMLISKSDVVSLNKEEAMDFTGKKDTINIIEEFKKIGLELISITDGSNGSILSDGETIIKSDVYHGKVEDTTGAGDAFLSGILLSTLRNVPLERMAKIASAMSYLECQEPGVRVGLPKSFEELEDFVNKNELNQVSSQIITK